MTQALLELHGGPGPAGVALASASPWLEQAASVVTVVDPTVAVASGVGFSA
ncbi:hypothetical protein [Kitasatospora aureofaciens]|uniref:hypothetical protein n=1 Tax=Kitasatospora aureofaciens TaxID=1894 RepID=UPI0037C64517